MGTSNDKFNVQWHGDAPWVVIFVKWHLVCYLLPALVRITGGTKALQDRY